MSDLLVSQEIETLAKSFAESAPGAPSGAWFKLSPALRNRWRERASVAAMEYENAIARAGK